LGSPLFLELWGKGGYPLSKGFSFLRSYFKFPSSTKGFGGISKKGTPFKGW